MTVNSVSSMQLPNHNAVETGGEHGANKSTNSFSTILENTYSTIGFATRADTVSSHISELSAQAQAYLEKLKQRFGDTDFIIADFATEELARELLKSGTGDYNCVLTPGLLEEMAADADVGAEYEALIESANDELQKMRESFTEFEIISLGFMFRDGCINYFASYVRDDITYDINAETIDELVEMIKGSDTYSCEERENLFYRECYEKMII